MNLSRPQRDIIIDFAIEDESLRPIKVCKQSASITALTFSMEAPESSSHNGPPPLPVNHHLKAIIITNSYLIILLVGPQVINQ